MLVIAPVELNSVQYLESHSAILGMVSRDLRPCPLDLSNRKLPRSRPRDLTVQLPGYSNCGDSGGIRMAPVEFLA